MGVCFYCIEYKKSWEECSSFEQAKHCAGITGPDDPARLQRKAAYDEYRRKKRIRELREQITPLEDELRRLTYVPS